MLSTLEAKNIKVGDELVAVSTYMTNLILNKTYIVKDIEYNSEFDLYYFKFKNMNNYKYLPYRFDINLKILRKNKLNDILNNAR